MSSKPMLAPHEVHIADGTTLADLDTVEACDMALLTLARDINRIEEQLADETLRPGDEKWLERAESAARFKRAIRRSIEQRIGAILRADRAAAARTHERLLIAQFKADWPAEFAASVAVVGERF